MALSVATIFAMDAWRENGRPKSRSLAAYKYIARRGFHGGGHLVGEHKCQSLVVNNRLAEREALLGVGDSHVQRGLSDPGSHSRLRCRVGRSS